MKQNFMWTARRFDGNGKVESSKYFETQEERDIFVAENPGWKKRGKICTENLERHLAEECKNKN